MLNDIRYTVLDGPSVDTPSLHAQRTRRLGTRWKRWPGTEPQARGAWHAEPFAAGFLSSLAKREAGSTPAQPSPAAASGDPLAVPSLFPGDGV